MRAPLPPQRLLWWWLCCASTVGAARAPAAEFSFSWPGETNFTTTRLSARDRTLLLDGEPLLVRGVTYSPTPIGKDMSSGDASLRVHDFFVEEHEAIWSADLELMRAMGMNAVRVYELRETGDHRKFLDKAYACNITVFPGFPLDESMNLLVTSTTAANPQDVTLDDVKQRLAAAVQVCAWHARTCTPCMHTHVHPADPCMCIACSSCRTTSSTGASPATT